MRKAWVLQEIERGFYRSTNLYIQDEEWQRDIANAIIYGSLEEVEYQANSLNSYSDNEFVTIIPITINIL